MDAKHSLVRKWLTKARRDLLSAKRLARGSSLISTLPFTIANNARKKP